MELYIFKLLKSRALPFKRLTLYLLLFPLLSSLENPF
jgi:hypothetical protein